MSNEAEVLEVVCRVLDKLAVETMAAGRNEIDATGIRRVVGELRLVGLEAPVRTTAEEINAMKEKEQRHWQANPGQKRP